jgi:hypothetical protein
MTLRLAANGSIIEIHLQDIVSLLKIVDNRAKTARGEGEGEGEGRERGPCQRPTIPVYESGMKRPQPLFPWQSLRLMVSHFDH